MTDSPASQSFFRLKQALKIFEGKPLILDLNLATYTPPPTDAQEINPWNGQLSPITSETALILFSSGQNVKHLMPLVLAVDPHAKQFDGNGIVCPEVKYGSDGRKINCVEGVVAINGVNYNYQAAFGVIVAAQFWGPMWNGLHEPPYTKLTADPIDSTDAQIDWTH
jgi:hypothetical protein